jgi:hypothetical protein
VIVYVLILSSGWTTKLNPVFWNIQQKNSLDNSFFYDTGNVQYRFKIEEETTFNVYALCRHLTELASLYGIMTTIQLIWYDIHPWPCVLPSHVILAFKLIKLNRTRRTLSQSRNRQLLANATIIMDCHLVHYRL